MLSLDIGLEMPSLSLDGANTTQPLNAEQYFIFEISVLLDVVVIELLLKVVLVGELSSGSIAQQIVFLH